jgi:hypothetical protein
VGLGGEVAGAAVSTPVHSQKHAHTHTHMQLYRHVRIDRDVHTYTYAYVFMPMYPRARSQKYLPASFCGSPLPLSSGTLSLAHFCIHT